MIAITIATPDYAHLAHDSAEWFRRNSGIETIVVHSNAIGPDAGYNSKLEIDRIHRGKIVFFDCDFRLVRDVRGVIQSWDASKFIGVHETCADKGGNFHFSFSDPRALGISIKHYLNTGFFVCDTRRASHRDVFARARQLMAEKSQGIWPQVIDYSEQTMLNYALHLSGVGISLRPIEWNWFFYAFRAGWTHFPRKIIGLHAAGVSGVNEKLDHLNAMTKVINIPR